MRRILIAIATFLPCASVALSEQSHVDFAFVPPGLWTCTYSLDVVGDTRSDPFASYSSTNTNRAVALMEAQVKCDREQKMHTMRRLDLRYACRFLSCMQELGAFEGG